jgi:hypothetical protein
MKRVVLKHCGASLMMDARNATKQDTATAFWLAARRVMTFGGFTPKEIDAECGKYPPAAIVEQPETGRPYAD